MNKPSKNAPLPLDFSAAAGVFDRLNAEQLAAVLRRGNAVVAAGFVPVPSAACVAFSASAVCAVQLKKLKIPPKHP